MTEHQAFKYDVFLSHSSKNMTAVRELAKLLKRDGLQVWFHEWEIRPDDPISERIEKGMEDSRVLVLCMSEQAFASDWAALESGTFRFRDPANKGRRFIPLRMDDATIKDSLRQFAYVDWRKKATEEYNRLVEVILSARARVRDQRMQTGPPYEARVLEEGISRVHSVAITSDGKKGVGGSHGGVIQVWDLNTGELVARSKGQPLSAWGLAIAGDGRRVVYCCLDNTLKVWDPETNTIIATLFGHTDAARCIALTGDGRRAISGGLDHTLRLWNLDTFECIAELEGHTGNVNSVSITPDGGVAISGSQDMTVMHWDLANCKRIAVLQGHTGDVNAVAITPDGRQAISGSKDLTVRVWDLLSHRRVAILEGHTHEVFGVAMTANGRRAFSCSGDQTVRVWDLEEGVLEASLLGHEAQVRGIAVTPDGQRIVTSAFAKSILVWTVTHGEKEAKQIKEATRYTNAKVLLVGESGVGKSGLAQRLTANQFVATVSTDGVVPKRTEWATQLKLPHTTNQTDTEREIWLWDFAGQADYRLTHQLYMDETALAVLVFNPQSENPFEGLGQWDRDLQRAARREYTKMLVAGRIDRGGLMISRDSIQRFLRERGFIEYIETSALTGVGCDTLRDAIVRHIPWDDIPWTASPQIFRRLKNEIVKLHDEEIVMLRVGELKQQLELRLPRQAFTLEQLRAVVGLLAGPGVVWQLEFGDFVLLQPERINAYAAAVIRSVRAHTEEIGCIAEEGVLAGKLDYQDMKRLSPEEEPIVLRAMHQTFVDHGLCLREHTDKGTLLIFPSYFKRERPELEGHPLVLVTYQFKGPLDEIYATLVVRLHHTTPFEKDVLWRFAADFKTHSGKRLGLKLTKKPEGAGELEIYFEPDISPDVQVTFIRYVHEHLKNKAQDVKRVRHYVCPHCHEMVENRRAIEVRLASGHNNVYCGVCGKTVLLWDLIEEKFASEEVQRRARELEEQARAAIDNESRELILIGHTYAIAGEANQIYRQYTNSDHGIDGEIEFKDYEGKASGKRLYLQLKSGDSYLYDRKEDGAEVFTIKNERHANYWQKQAYPVMLVIRTSDGMIRWMDISEYLKRENRGGQVVSQVVFAGEPLTALNLRLMRDRFVLGAKAK